MGLETGAEMPVRLTPRPKEVTQPEPQAGPVWHGTHLTTSLCKALGARGGHGR